MSFGICISYSLLSTPARIARYERQSYCYFKFKNGTPVSFWGALLWTQSTLERSLATCLAISSLHYWREHSFKSSRPWNSNITIPPVLSTVLTPAFWWPVGYSWLLFRVEVRLDCICNCDACPFIIMVWGYWLTIRDHS